MNIHKNARLTPKGREVLVTQFYQPIVHDYANFGTWSERGGRDANSRATDVWQSLVAEKVQPGAGGDRLEALRDFIARRTAEGGAPPES